MSEKMGVEEAINESKQFVKFVRAFLKLSDVIDYVASAKQSQKEAEDLRNKAKKELESINLNIERAKNELAGKLQEAKNKVPMAINEANKEIETALASGRAEVLSLKNEVENRQNKISEDAKKAGNRIASLRSEEEALSIRVDRLKHDLDAIRKKVGV